MNETELKQQIIELEARISKLEALFAKHAHKAPGKLYEGLSGGIRRLLDNGFFDVPKSLNEVIDELKREGYKLSVSGVASTLSVTFTHKQRSLMRIKDEKGWKYERRK